MLSDLKISTSRPLAYPYQRRPVFVANEDDSTEESLLFRREKSQKNGRAHSAAETSRQSRIPTSDNKNHPNFQIPQEIITSNHGLITPSEDLENNLSTTGQELYIVDDNQGINR